MENKKQYCEGLFKEYIELENKISARTTDPRDGIIATPLSEMNKLFDLRKKIKGCFAELSDNQLLELYGHPELEDAQRVLVERKNNK